MKLRIFVVLAILSFALTAVLGSAQRGVNLSKFGKTLAVWILIGLLLVALFHLFQSSSRREPQATLAFSDFLNDVNRGQVSNVTIQGNNISGHFTDSRAFTTYAPNDPNLVNRLTEKNVRITGAPVDENLPSLLGVLISWLPTLVFGLLLILDHWSRKEFNADRPIQHWRAVAKWLEDKVLSTLILFLCAPLIAITALLIKLDSRGPVLSVQERLGVNNDMIEVLKFRTMYVDRGGQSSAQRTVQNDPRVTRVGRILGVIGLDTLPQLINVLRGDMSLVGPRSHAIAMRNRVKPGITGWAQVNGLGSEVDTLERAHARVAHDLYYIDHWSLSLDLKILLKTAATTSVGANF
jgi:lipopolysaccharide/colanic/teichoic acid biosynthesis glycosyltransferase